MKIDFTNPRELLDEIIKHQRVISMEVDIESNSQIISNRESQVLTIISEKAPLDQEVLKVQQYYERGLLDRIALRESLGTKTSLISELERRIHSLQSEINYLKSHNESLQAKVDAAKDFLKFLDSKVVTFSVVEIIHRGEHSNYLLVPEKIRENHWNHEIPLLSVEAELGKALLNQEVGVIKTSNYRFEGLEVKEVQIVDEFTLLKFTKSPLQGRAEPTLSARPRSSGAVQRWRDGARDDFIIVCSRCNTYDPSGAPCNCIHE